MDGLTPLEIAAGWVFGQGPRLLPDRPEPTPKTPREVLEDVLLEAMSRPPFGIAFSGGRDSSLLLAVAAHVASRQGLPAPVPLTLRYPNAPASVEDDWQERVVRHIGLADWERVAIDDELDLLGPVATAVRAKHGILWPAAAHTSVPLYERQRGGTLVTGEGGDEILGPRRGTAVVRMLTGTSRPGRTMLRHARDNLGPQFWRRRAVAAQVRVATDHDWLLPGAKAEIGRLVHQRLMNEPVSWWSGTTSLVEQRAWQVGTATRQALAGDHNVAVVDPLCDPRFLAALAVPAGRMGFTGRSAVTAMLADGLLPDAVTRRSDKAHFSEAVFNRQTRAFAKAWSGNGLDEDLVDPERLRVEWLSELPHAMTAMALQQASMAS